MKLACLAGLGALSAAAHGQVVISQLYMAGGNSGAVYNHDYVELYNQGPSAVTLTGYAVQYGAAGSSTWKANTITGGTIASHGYFLIQLAGGTNGAVVPTPDMDMTVSETSGNLINMAATGGGKMCLTSNNTVLAGTCPSGAAVVDFVGYGSANCSEGSSNAPVPSTTAALFRGPNGCVDSNVNGADFSSGTPAPRNTGSSTFNCPSSTPPSGAGSTNGSVCPGSNVKLFVTVTPGSNPTSTGLSVTVDASSIGGSATEPLYDDATHGDVTSGDKIFTTTVTAFASAGTHNLPVTITDAQSRTGNSTISVTALNANPTGFANAIPSGLCSNESTLITCTATNGCATSGALTVTADLSAVGGSATQTLYDDGTNGDATAGDGLFSYQFTPSNTPDGTYTLHAQVTDSLSHTSNQLAFPLTLSSSCVNSSSTVVISQVYGGGGNGGAQYTNDFIELFNRGTTAVDLTGWSVQYASGQDDPNGFGVTDQTGPRLTVLSGTIQPGHYYLVQEVAGAGSAQSLPTPDATGTINLSATRGAVALVNGSTALGLNSCSNAGIKDLVGYGNGSTQATTAFCSETSPVATLSNTTAAVRRDGGCHDVDNNAIDMNVDVPAPRNSATAAHLCSPPVCCLSDYNGDGDIGTDLDIEAFFSCLAGNCCPKCPPTADFNCDGDIGTDTDIESFFRVLAGGAC
jgi:hypothetical protein